MRQVNPRQEETAAIISSLGLTNLQDHFQGRRHQSYTWSQRHNSRLITSICDYILTWDRTDFQNLQITATHFMFMTVTIVLSLGYNRQQIINVM